VDTSRITPQHAHGSLIAMTVMIQIAVGMVSFGWKTPGQKLPMAAALAIAHIGLGCSLLHLGRPAFAWRALKMWRRSWLSREVLFFSLFVSAGTVLLPLLWMNLPWTGALAAVAILSGWAGLFSSASIYLLPARPAWNTIHTILEFPLTALMLGPLALLAFGSGNNLWLELAGAAAAAQLLNQTAKLLRPSYCLGNCAPLSHGDLHWDS
jgi:formate dehydrogenase iron-sulfur subunit